MSTGIRGENALTCCMVELSLLLSPAAFAAAAATAPPAATAPAPTKPPEPGKSVDQLNDVVVSGEKPTRQPSVLIDWIRRLPGQYTIDGKVDLGGKGNPNERWSAYGTGSCVAFGVAPGVTCEINVRWPPMPGPNGPEVMSAVSDLAPAMIAYAMEPDDLGIRYMMVNSKGLAEGTTGYIIGDTATFKTPCVNAPPSCQRVIRITVESGNPLVEMQVDTELNTQLAGRFNFKFRRVAQLQAEAPKDAKVTAPATAKPAAPAKPAKKKS
jgi:hypothetical protein